MCTVQQSHLNYAVPSRLLFSNLLRNFLFYGTENLITDFTNPLVELIQNQSLSLSSAGSFAIFNQFNNNNNSNNNNNNNNNNNIFVLLFSGCLTLRSLTLYIYGAPILDVSRSHTTTQHSR
jgi:hypothetical protein